MVIEPGNVDGSTGHLFTLRATFRAPPQWADALEPYGRPIYRHAFERWRDVLDQIE
jgi:hypothetical protein